MASTSRVAATIAGLYARGQTMSCRVFYGPNITDHALKEWVEVGVDDPETSGASGMESASAVNSFGSLGNRSREQVITVSCAVCVWNGNGDEAGLRAALERAYVILGEFEDALWTDATIADSVLFSRVSQERVRPAQTKDGSLVYVLFDVEARAQLRRA